MKNFWSLGEFTRLLTLVNGEALEKELSKYATTNERKRAWILIDGKRTTEEIGQAAGMKLRTIQDFLKTLNNASLTESRPPKRIIDYVPASWLDLLQPGDEDKKPKGEKDVKATSNQ